MELFEDVRAKIDSDPWLRGIVEGSFDSIISKDLTGRILSWNRAAEQIYGYTSEEAVGGHITLIIPDDRSNEYADIMARLEKGEKVPPFETKRRRKDGMIIDILLTITPVKQEDGEFVAAWSMAQDITARKRAQATMEGEKRKLDVIMDTVPAAIWLVEDPASGRAMGSRYAAQMFRVEGEDYHTFTLPLGRSSEHYRITKGDKELPLEDYPLFRAIRGNEVRGEELAVKFDDDTKVWQYVNASPVRDDHGEVTGAVGAALNITERKQAEQQQELLMAELDHRVKNILAMIHSIIRQTLPDGPSAQALAGRVQTLASTHQLLTTNEWRGGNLKELLVQELSMYFGGREDSITINGPEVILPPQSTQMMGLVIHELVTNAAKYGALSRPDGTLAVEWHIQEDESPTLELRWSERNDHHVTAPAAPGFGTTLIKQSVEFGLNGIAESAFTSNGVDWRINVPLSGAGAQK